MPALDVYCEEALRKLDASSQRRELREVLRHDGVWLTHENKQYLSFSCNDYFGLSQNQEVRQAGADAALKYGAGAGASRLVTGNHPLYAQLEAQLAEAKSKEAALVFGSGYLANLAAVSTLIGPEDLIVADKLIHACMIDGAKLSGAKLMRFAHNDIAHAEQLIQKHRASYRHCWVLTESIFSMDGDRAPIKNLRALADAHDAWLMVDDAHGLGLPDVHAELADVVIGTLSKAAGSYGGYVSTSEIARDFLINNGRSFIFTTGLSYADTAFSIRSLSLIKEKNNTERMLNNLRYFCNATGVQNNASPIVPWHVGGSERAIALQAKLKEDGLWVQAIRPPTVPTGSARLRIAFSALHEREHIDRLVEALKRHG